MQYPQARTQIKAVQHRASLWKSLKKRKMLLCTFPPAWATSFTKLNQCAVPCLRVRFHWPWFTCAVASGLWFYGYNELATMTIKKTSAVTQVRYTTGTNACNAVIPHLQSPCEFNSFSLLFKRNAWHCLLSLHANLCKIYLVNWWKVWSCLAFWKCTQAADFWHCKFIPFWHLLICCLQSVANTAKRVIVIVGVAIVLGESLDPIKLLGCAIGIGGVFLYSIIDTIFKPKSV